MVYRVSLSARAEDGAYAAFERIRDAAPMHAEKWLDQARHVSRTEPQASPARALQSSAFES